MIRPLALLAAAALLLPSAAAAQTAAPKTNLSDIEDEVICLVCGTTLELAESAPQAEQLRNQIRDLIDEGKDKQQIKDELVAEYGENVLATPDDSGFDLAAWVLPVVGLLLALAGVTVFVLRGRRRDGAQEPEITPADAERLEADMRSYDV